MPREIIGKDPVSLGIGQYELAPLKAGEIRAKTQYGAPKHGTEIHGFVNKPDDVPMYYDEETKCFLPQTPEMLAGQKGGMFRPGNMWVGFVTEVAPDVTEYAVGDRVCSYGPLREYHTLRVHADNQAGLGANNDLYKLPEGMSWQAALCYDPCQFALCGIRDSQLRLGDTCLISGLGAIGLMAAQMARLQGAKTVIVSDPIEKRRQIALACGADYAIDPLNEDCGLMTKRLTGNLGADVVVETSGTYPALQAALRGVAYAGRIAVVGWYGRDRGGFDIGHEGHMNNATLFFSRACSEPNPDYPRWSWARLNSTSWELLSQGKIACEGVIDPIVSFEEAPAAYRTYVVDNPALSVKMGVKF